MVTHPSQDISIILKNIPLLHYMRFEPTMHLKKKAVTKTAPATLGLKLVINDTIKLPQIVFLLVD